MKWIMEHFGNALIAAVVLIALGAVIVAIVKSPFIQTQFEGLLTWFFGDMQGIAG